MKLPKTPSFRLDGRKALVTGAGRGLGLAMAAGLAEAGADVSCMARRSEEVEAVAHALSDAGFKAKATPGDVTDRAAMQAVIADHGPFQVLVNCAGAARNVPLEDVSEADFDLVQGVNFKAAYFLTLDVTADLKARGLPGSVINVSSQMGLVGGPKRTVYCGTKHAMEGWTKAMALELGPHNIRVNTICPTFFHTELTKDYLADQEFYDWVISKIALGRVGQPEEVMGAAVFLASDASSLITGSSLVIDGGWTAA